MYAKMRANYKKDNRLLEKEIFSADKYYIYYKLSDCLSVDL